MLLEIGVLAAAYVGAKTLPEDHEINKKIRDVTHKIKTQVREMFFAAPDSRETPEQNEDEPSEGLSKEDRQKELDTTSYADASLGAMAAFGVSGFFPLLLPLGIGAYIFAMMPHMRDVDNVLRKEKRINVDCLFMVADILALTTGHVIAAGFSLYLIHSGKLAVARARDDSRKMVAHLFRDLPKEVWILRDETEVSIPLMKIRKDDIVVLHSGSVVPVDGTITQGVAGINQQALTGEATLFEKGPGEAVFANTIVVSGRILVRVEKSGHETTSCQIAQSLFNSVNHKTGVQLKGEEWADMLTTPMLAASLLLVPVLGPSSAAVFINSHMGVRIRLLAPMGTLKHISLASQQGILVKDGRALERFKDLDTILFDKTGTLTYDSLEVTRIIPCKDLSEREILFHAAVAEQKLTHPIAKAILRKAWNQDMDLPKIEYSAYALGYGIQVQLAEALIHVGSERYMREQELPIPETMTKCQAQALEHGANFIFVAVDYQIQGGLELKSQMRSEMKDVVRELREQGFKHLAIVSGDQEAATRELAQALDMDAYYHSVLPEEKAEIVKKFQAGGHKVCFIGDGINDAVALRAADVAISMAGASHIAQDMVEIILMNGHLGLVNDLNRISTDLEKNLEKSFKLCVTPGIINLLGTFLFNFSIMTSLLVNGSFGFIGALNAFPDTRQEIKKQTPEEENPEVQLPELTQ